MNRIILIGNGFDLAHGLPTSYSDFIEWYWDQWGDRLIHGSSNVESDRLCSFRLSDEWNDYKWHDALGFIRRENRSLTWDAKLTIEVAKTHKDLCDLTYISSFFKEICDSVETKGWVDVENVFYKHLCKDIISDDYPQKLNDDLDVIRQDLIEYLSELQSTTIAIKDNIKNKIIEPFKDEDISIESMPIYLDFKSQISFTANNIKYPTRIMMLNFNYTSLADKYLPDNNDDIVNHIHGSLSNPDSIIFGYGDELDENYKTILNKNDNEYLRNIKSIKYLESPNYRKLLEFIESSPYQIYIMGHSCGNSDRTLLNTLFEHKNCVSIKPFYHKKSDGTDNYIELVQNISRNFTDMKLMRDRVVNKTYCEALT